MPPSEKGNNKGVEVMDNKAKAKRLGFVALRTFLVVLFSAIISALSRSLVFNGAYAVVSGDSFDREMLFPDRALNVAFMILFLLIFNSMIIAINRHDKHTRERFFESVNENKLISRLKFTALSVDFCVEFGCVTVLSLLLPTSFLYGFVSKIFFAGVENKLYTLLIMLPIMLVIVLVAHVSLQRGWYLEELRKKANLTKKSKKTSVVKSVLLVTAVYCLGAICTPWIWATLITVNNFAGGMGLVWLAITLTALVLSVVAIFYIRALLKRRSFVKKLKRYCFDNRLYLSKVNTPYRSVFTSKEGFDFTVEKNMISYDCKFIAGVLPNAPIILSDDGHGFRQISVRMFRTKLFQVMTQFDFGYESKNRKILILLPTPKKFLLSIGGFQPRGGDVGEKVGEYTVYNATGFLNALDRDTL